MAILGLSILLASISYLVYKKPPQSWFKYYPTFFSKWPAQEQQEAQLKAPIIVADDLDDDGASKRTEEKDKVLQDRQRMPPPSSRTLSTSPVIERRPYQDVAATAAPRLDGSSPGAGSKKASNRSQLSTSSTPTNHDRVMTAKSPSPSLLSAASPSNKIPTPSSSSMAPPPSSTTRRPLPTASLFVPVTTTTTKTTPKPRKKVILTPGHSPLDWANLQQQPNINLRGLSHPHLMPIRPSQLRQHNGRGDGDAWAAFSGKVYNITPYLDFHPGGVPELMRAAGNEATKLFAEVHPWVSVETMLRGCLLGVLVPEHYQVPSDQEAGAGRWAEMD